MKKKNLMISKVFKKTALFMLSLIFGAQGAFAQFTGCTISLAPFSTPFSDEFAPVFYKHGLAYCSNRTESALIRYSSSEAPLFKMVYSEQISPSNWKRPVLLSSEMTAGYHEGPASLSKDGMLIYFSRNNEIERSLRNIKDTSNKLGIYIAEKADDKWTHITPFIYNDTRYIFTTPALDPEGLRLYFSSDKPGGYGGMDLYYCVWCENKWCQPVNMGPVVNSSGNESFPYADGSGKLYFSSDKNSGMGGKDLYFTLHNNESWIAPVPLDSVFNSPYDDFGIVVDSTGQSGYFSSNRLQTDDIFQFKAAYPEFKNCAPVEQNNYCYTFYDEHNPVDSIPLLYIWDFGDGVIRKGREVGHCFPGPGNYSVILRIIDLMTDSTLVSRTEYPVVLKEPHQPNIRSVNTALTNQSVSFTAEIPAHENLDFTGYYWDNGEGFSSDKPNWNVAFSKKGLYTIRLGLTSIERTTGITQNFCVSKQIQILDEIQMIKTGDAFGASDMMAKIILSGKIPRTCSEAIERIFSDIPAGFHQNLLVREMDSCALLHSLVTLLTDNPYLKLEMMVSAPAIGNLSERNVVTEQWAQQLTFFFKKYGLGADRIESCAADHALFTEKHDPTPELAAGIVEFIIIAQ